MSKAGLAKVSRRRFNLETVVFSAQQEVTVPAAIKIPVNTQYLLQPLLVVPKEKINVNLGPGRVRIQGQLEGFQSCVDSDETVHTFPVPPLEFMTSFTVPASCSTAKLETDVVLEGVEVDRGDGEVANITVSLLVTLWALQFEETELVTAVSGNSLSGETQREKIQHIIKEVETEQSLIFSLPLLPGKPVATDLCIGNLSWQVDQGKMSAEGVAMVKVYYLMEETGGVYIAEGSEDFALDLDFAVPEVSDSTLQCYPVKTLIASGAEGQEFELILKARAVGYHEETGECVTSVVGADSLTKLIHLRNRIGESEYKLNLEGICQFPVEPLTIEAALPKVRLLETTAQDGKVLVRGLLSLSIYYTDENQQKRVLVQEEEFNHHLELKGCASGYTVKSWAWPQKGVYGQESYSVPVLLRVEVVETKEFKVVTDVHVVDTDFVPVNASVVLYVAGADDSLFSVARKFNISQEQLIHYNGLSGEALHAGQKLLIPIYQLKYKS